MKHYEDVLFTHSETYICLAVFEEPRVRLHTPIADYQYYSYDTADLETSFLRYSGISSTLNFFNFNRVCHVLHGMLVSKLGFWCGTRQVAMRIGGIHNSTLATPRR